MGQERQLINLEINLTTGSGISIWGKHDPREREGADYVLALKENRTRASCLLRPARRYARSPEPAALPNGAEPVTHDRCEWRRRHRPARHPVSACGPEVPRRPLRWPASPPRRRVLGTPRGASPSVVLFPALPKYIPAKRLVAHFVAPPIGASRTSCDLVLDVVFNEDRTRTRKDNAPENLADTPKARPQSGAQPPLCGRKSNAQGGTCSVICDTPAPCGGG